MQKFAFVTFTSVANGKVVSMVDWEPYLHQSDVDVDNSDPRQHWLRWPYPLVDGEEIFLNRASNGAVDIVGNVFADHQSLQQHEENDGDNQRWRVVDWEEDQSQKILVNAVNPGFVWDVPYGDPGATLQIYGRHDQDNQRWTIDVLPAWEAPAFKISNVSSRLVLDIPNHSQDDYAKIQTYDNLTGDLRDTAFNQFWLFFDPDQNILVSNLNNSAFVKIISVCTGKALQVLLPESGNLNEPAYVVQAPFANTDDQLWKPVPQGGHFVFRPFFNLDFALRGQGDMFLITVEQNNGSDQQLWDIV